MAACKPNPNRGRYPELELQKLLRSDKRPEDLQSTHAIKARRGTRHPNLVSFKYGIDAPFAEKACREARALVLDEADNWAVACQGFEKFFNLGEGFAPALDLSTTRAFEKVDGTLIVAYQYAGGWEFATTGTPDATTGDPTPFRELFMRTYARPLPPATESFDNFYFFELCTPENRVVVHYAESKIVALGGRSAETGKEFPAWCTADDWGVEAVVEHPFDDYEGMQRLMADSPATEREGVVCVDGAWNRVKLKTPQYALLHHMKSSWTDAKMWDAVRAGESGELGAYFPEKVGQIQRANARMAEVAQDIEQDLTDFNGRVTTQKEFAALALKTPYSGILFGVRGGRYGSVREALRTISLDAFVQIMGSG